MASRRALTRAVSLAFTKCLLVAIFCGYQESADINFLARKRRRINEPSGGSVSPQMAGNGDDTENAHTGQQLRFRLLCRSVLKQGATHQPAVQAPGMGGGVNGRGNAAQPRSGGVRTRGRGRGPRSAPPVTEPYQGGGMQVRGGQGGAHQKFERGRHPPGITAGLRGGRGGGRGGAAGAGRQGGAGAPQGALQGRGVKVCDGGRGGLQPEVLQGGHPRTLPAALGGGGGAIRGSGVVAGRQGQGGAGGRGKHPPATAAEQGGSGGRGPGGAVGAGRQGGGGAPQWPDQGRGPKVCGVGGDGVQHQVEQGRHPPAIHQGQGGVGRARAVGTSHQGRGRAPQGGVRGGGPQVRMWGRGGVHPDVVQGGHPPAIPAAPQGGVGAVGPGRQGGGGAPQWPDQGRGPKVCGVGGDGVQHQVEQGRHPPAIQAGQGGVGRAGAVGTSHQGRGGAPQGGVRGGGPRMRRWGRGGVQTDVVQGGHPRAIPATLRGGSSANRGIGVGAVRHGRGFARGRGKHPSAAAAEQGGSVGRGRIGAVGAGRQGGGGAPQWPDQGRGQKVCGGGRDEVQQQVEQGTQPPGIQAGQGVGGGVGRGVNVGISRQGRGGAPQGRVRGGGGPQVRSRGQGGVQQEVVQGGHPPAIPAEQGGGGGPGLGVAVEAGRQGGRGRTQGPVRGGGQQIRGGRRGGGVGAGRQGRGGAGDRGRPGRGRGDRPQEERQPAVWGGHDVRPKGVDQPEPQGARRRKLVNVDPLHVYHEHDDVHIEPPPNEPARARAMNWSEPEKESLFMAVNANYKYIRGHFTHHSNGNRLKEKAWREVVAYVNEVSETVRDKAQCERKMQDYTIEAKEKLRVLKEQMAKTGNGQINPELLLKDSHKYALDAAGPVAVEGIPGGMSTCLFHSRPHEVEELPRPWRYDRPDKPNYYAIYHDIETTSESDNEKE